jgi:hypothetical protein
MHAYKIMRAHTQSHTYIHAPTHTRSRTRTAGGMLTYLRKVCTVDIVLFCMNQYCVMIFKSKSTMAADKIVVIGRVIVVTDMCV